MKYKNYSTAKQAAELEGVTYDALRKRLLRDSKKPKSKRKYKHAFKMGRDWFIPDRDLILE